MNKKSKIFLAGHKGLVGSAIYNNLLSKGYTNIIYRTHQELDLADQNSVADFFKEEQPEIVVLAAAKVGGILANNIYRADFIYENLMIQNNVIHHSYLNGVKKLLFLGSTCIYPKECEQPISENSLLTSALEYTNEPYAIAKIAGIKMCESYNIQYGTNFISVMPTNLYGPNDNFDLEKSHVLPALLRKIYLAKQLNEGNWDKIREDLNKRPINSVTGNSEQKEIVTVLSKYGVKSKEVEIWGSGKPRREFLWSEDMADACVYFLEEINFLDMFHNQDDKVRNTHVNIGTGIDTSIRELAEIIKQELNYQADFIFDTSKPDGTMQKLTDVKKLNSLGWKHRVSLQEGIQKIYNWYIAN